jgi:hypothetical protein
VASRAGAAAARGATIDIAAGALPGGVHATPRTMHIE